MVHLPHQEPYPPRAESHCRLSRGQPGAACASRRAAAASRAFEAGGGHRLSPWSRPVPRATFQNARRARSSARPGSRLANARSVWESRRRPHSRNSSRESTHLCHPRLSVTGSSSPLKGRPHAFAETGPAAPQRTAPHLSSTGKLIS